MLRTFCDNCGAPASLSARRFEGLSAADNGTKLGLDAVVTYGGAVVPDRHLCDECVVEFLITAAKSFAGSAAAAKHRSFLDTSVDQAKVAAKLDQKRSRLDALEAELDTKLTAIAGRESAMETKVADDARQIAVLTAQIGVLRGTFEDRVRQAVAAEAQKKVDMAEEPDFVERVRRREAARAAAR